MLKKESPLLASWALKKCKNGTVCDKTYITNVIILLTCFCCFSEIMLNGIASTDESRYAVISSQLSEPSCNSAAFTSNGRSRRCSLIKEEVCEDDEDELGKNDLAFGEVKECRSANVLSSNDTNSMLGKPPTTPVAPCTRMLQTVHSMPQLALNQISEEDEDDEMSASSFPQGLPTFSIAGAANFGGCATRANRKSSTKKTVGIHSGTLSMHRPTAALQPKTTPTNGHSFPIATDASSWTATVGQHSNSTDAEDETFVGRSFQQREPLPQLSKTGTDMEVVDSGTESSGLFSNTSSLDRRLFQNRRKDGKGGPGRSLVGAVKKSVSMLLGHLSAVGDMTSAKPRRIETWSSCSDLLQASARLRGTASTSLNLADRHRVAGCQLARELRQNRSEREAQFNDTKNSQSSSSSCVIRFRSRDFDALVSKFTAGDQTAVAGTVTDTS